MSRKKQDTSKKPSVVKEIEKIDLEHHVADRFEAHVSCVNSKGIATLPDGHISGQDVAFLCPKPNTTLSAGVHINDTHPESFAQNHEIHQGIEKVRGVIIHCPIGTGPAVEAAQIVGTGKKVFKSTCLPNS